MGIPTKTILKPAHEISSLSLPLTRQTLIESWLTSAFSVLSNKTIAKGIASRIHRRAFQHMEEILEEVKALYAVPRMFFARRVELLSTENAEVSQLSG